jgi:hypothetical protein
MGHEPGEPVHEVVAAIWLYGQPDYGDDAMCSFIKETKERNARRNARAKTDGNILSDTDKEQCGHC